MTSDATQTRYSIPEYPPSGLHQKLTTYGLHCVGEEFQE